MFRYDRLDELIKITGKKKNYLSEKLGYSGRYLNDARKQGTNIKEDAVEILAEELGTTVEYLTGKTDEKKPTPVSESGLEPERIELLEEIRSMDIERVKGFLAAIGKRGGGNAG